MPPANSSDDRSKRRRSRRHRARNVIGAPLPANILQPIYRRLQYRIDRVERALAGLRTALCVLASFLVWASPNAPIVVIGISGYTTLAVLALLMRQRKPTPSFNRFFALADIVVVPGLLVMSASSLQLPDDLLALVTIVGVWIILNALTGKTRRTRFQIGVYLMLVVAAVATTAGNMLLFVVAVPLAAMAIGVARIQQYRLVGHTIQSAERLQRTLALQDPPASGEIPSTN